MKKSVSVILIITLLLSLFVTAAAEDTSTAPQVTLKASSEEVKANSTVTLTLALEGGSLDNISSFEYYVHYNPQVVTLTGSMTSNTLVGVGTPPAENYDSSCTDAAVTVSAVDLKNGTFTMTEGTIATLTFTAKQDALSGADCDLTLAEVAVCNTDSLANSITISNGEVSDVRIERAQGDVNGVPGVDIGDVQRIYAFANSIDGVSLTDEEKDLADEDKDSEVTESDALTLFRRIFGISND